MSRKYVATSAYAKYKYWCNNNINKRKHELPNYFIGNRILYEMYFDNGNNFKIFSSQYHLYPTPYEAQTKYYSIYYDGDSTILRKQTSSLNFFKKMKNFFSSNFKKMSATTTASAQNDERRDQADASSRDNPPPVPVPNFEQFYEVNDYKDMMADAYEKYTNHNQSLKDGLIENFGETWMKDLSPEKKELFERAEQFLAMCSFDHVPHKTDKLPISEHEVMYLNDFRVEFWWRWIHDADFKMEDGKRVWNNGDMDEFFEATGRWDEPVVMTWLKKGRTDPVYNERVLFLVENMIRRGRFQGDYDTYEYIVAYAIKYGSFDSLLAILHALYNCGVPEVGQLIDENFDVYTIFAAQYLNLNAIRLIETHYQYALHNTHIDWEFVLMCACMMPSDQENGTLDYIYSKMPEAARCMMINPVQLMHHRAWGRLAQLRKLGKKHNRWNITEEQIRTRMFEVEKDNMEWRRKCAEAMGYTYDSTTDTLTPVPDVVEATA